MASFQNNIYEYDKSTPNNIEFNHRTCMVFRLYSAIYWTQQPNVDEKEEGGNKEFVNKTKNSAKYPKQNSNQLYFYWFDTN